MEHPVEPTAFKHADDLQTIEPYSEFLAVCKSAHTRSNYHHDLRILKQFLDDSGISSPTLAQARDLAKFAAQLSKPGRTPAGKSRDAFSTRSIKRVMASTRSFYRFLASLQLVTNDPTVIFHNMAIRSPHRNPRPLPPQDREALIHSLRTDEKDELRASLTVLLGFHCGLRVSEIAHLRRDDLDFTQKLLRVIGKGDKERSIPMTDRLCGLLRRYLELEEAQIRGPYLFPSPRSGEKPIHPHFLENWAKLAARWAGFEKPEEFTVHVLRHTFGTLLAESGASMYEIRDLMGHSSIVVSENYVKLASTRARQAHQKAFEDGLKVHAVNLKKMDEVGGLLKRFQKLRRKLALEELEKD